MTAATARQCRDAAYHRAEQCERLAARATERGDIGLAAAEAADAVRHRARAARWEVRAREIEREQWARVPLAPSLRVEARPVSR